MNEPKRIQRKRTKGWKMPEGAVYVGRPTRWGNPFAIQHVRPWPQWAGSPPYEIATPDGKIWPHQEPHHPVVGRLAAARAHEEAARTTAVELYRLHTGPMGNYEIETSDLEALSGHDLACWCPLDQPCHADVLLELANREPA